MFTRILSIGNGLYYITSPYLIIDYDLTRKCKNAAMRSEMFGLSRLYITGQKHSTDYRGSYRELEAGVRIYEYTQALSTKNVIADDELAMSTINFDYRNGPSL